MRTYFLKRTQDGLWTRCSAAQAMTCEGLPTRKLLMAPVVLFVLATISFF